ncbi:hypothetical protein H072_4581 [Dactylellina haptotyla CBS 200.50]|uniref:Protein arginine methyltransferase NDUFAF7 n=1 Tax=Dactylellina haptotyla (strain CBS 200.50) TaxID=1284197 RepID=S8AEN4_DACHA|nr:hypothetical protein H072_4581 [Dactylellina haptotyla CBS 200.50]
MATQRCIRRLASISSKEAISSRWRPALLPQSRRVHPTYLTRRTASTAPSLGQSIAKAIEADGPISLVHYMRQCLTGKDGGYYTTSPDPFGNKGDFVTSPEISQIFGEMIGIWIVAEWLAQNMCNGKKITLIELGPGRGTLMDDILRVISRFKDLSKQISGVQLVEASQMLRDTQCARLCGDGAKPEWRDVTWGATSKYFDAPVSWYEDVRQVNIAADEAPFYIAHEFFDALPINAFKNTSDGWRELLVDLKKPTSNLILPAGAQQQEPEFCLALAPRQSASARALNSLSPRYEALSRIADSTVELSPDSHSIVIELCKSIHHANAGGALIMDYGPAETVPVNSLRGIQRHKRVSPFTQPGRVDISADVDFGALAETALRPDLNVEVHGPAEQGHFLFGLGIEERYKQISKTTSDPEKLAILKSGFDRLTERGGLGMGRIYKALAIVPEANGRAVAGFQRFASEYEAAQEQDGEAQSADERPAA